MINVGGEKLRNTLSYPCSHIPERLVQYMDTQRILQGGSGETMKQQLRLVTPEAQDSLGGSQAIDVCHNNLGHIFHDELGHNCKFKTALFMIVLGHK